MPRNQRKTAKKKRATKNESTQPHFFVDLEHSNTANRSITLMVASRTCYACKQSDEEEWSQSTGAEKYIDCIAEHCQQTSDYLLPDTPIKEAIFRVILSHRNQPTNADDISRTLSEKWALSPYPTDISPKVILHLLKNSEAYFISQSP